MPSSDWRAPATYGHAKSIVAAGFAWEYLRRDDDYRRDFERIRALPERATELSDAFSSRWGLRFPGCPGHTCRSGRTLLDAGAPT